MALCCPALPSCPGDQRGSAIIMPGWPTCPEKVADLLREDGRFGPRRRPIYSEKRTFLVRNWKSYFNSGSSDSDSRFKYNSLSG